MAFGFNSTTDEVLSGCDLSGKTVMVTGASAGIGAETARAMAACGADVTLVARNINKLEAVAACIRSVARGNIEIGAIELEQAREYLHLHLRLAQPPSHARHPD